jgi:hypothetical protein
MNNPRRARRRLGPVLVALVVAIPAIWTGVWFYAASAAEAAIAGWRAREASSGRHYECGQQTIGGFPFRIEVRCTNPNAELRGQDKPFLLKGTGLVVQVQLHRPTVLFIEFSGPMTAAEAGQPPAYVVNWSLGQSSVRGTPRNPQHGSLRYDDLTAQRSGDGAGTTVFIAKRIELDARIAEGSASSNPVIEVMLRAVAAAAPELHALAVVPVDAAIDLTLRGLPDFAPKPLRARLRELQARGGRIEVAKARVQQGEVIAVGSGALGLTERGNLDGQLQLTVVGMAQLLKSLDLESIVSQGKVGATIDRLDRLIPGLGKIARKNAAPGIVAGLDAIGTRTTLEGMPAVTLPLRFDDGRVMLGPLPVGRVPPLF